MGHAAAGTHEPVRLSISYGYFPLTVYTNYSQIQSAPAVLGAVRGRKVQIALGRPTSHLAGPGFESLGGGSNFSTRTPSWQAVGEGVTALTLATHVGKSRLSSGGLPAGSGPRPAGISIWEVNQQMGDAPLIFLCLSNK